jgi:transcriptional repressor NrdR
MESRVVDSRVTKDGANIRRRRECEQCQRRFTTYERVEESIPFIIKKDGRREAYDRSKLLSGMSKACEKRPISVQTIESVINKIEKSLQDLDSPEVNSSVIGERVMEELKLLDEVAYVRFASVYRSFKDINEFMDELKDVLRGKE